MNKLEEARKQIDEIDKEMAELFEKRMEAAKLVAEYKAENSLPVFDPEREHKLFEKNSDFIKNEEILPYYLDFLKETVSVSKNYQKKLLSSEKTVHVNLPSGSYDITIESGVLKKAGSLLNLDRKVLIVTDSGVPSEYAKTVAAQCRTPYIATIPEGEESKALDIFEELCSAMLEHGFTRTDCVVAVGGGMVGDLAGFAAASYMRGIDFYNIPTTVLSMTDSSVGGKTAVNLGGIKNIVGAFYQPKAVLIDPETLKTLSEHHFSNGLAEAVKMALAFDNELFEFFESSDAHEHIETVIGHSVKTKATVVEKDEKESGLRKALNFGHTIGHAIESSEEFGGLYHGECVALGMIPMCSPEIRERLKAVLKKLGLPTEYQGDIEKLSAAASHDKKFAGEKVTVVTVHEIGSFRFEEWSTAELFERMEEFLK